MSIPRLQMNSRYICYIILIIFISPVIYQAKSLYVFYPTTIRPMVLEKKLSKTCPDIKIIVFGRYRDFKKSIEKNSPDAILTRTPLIFQFSKYIIMSRGIRNGETDEPYVFLSINHKVNFNRFSNPSIGIVNFLGRDHMKLFVGNLLNRSQRLKQVTKIEDLLPLLTFKMAECILITEKNISFFKKISNLNLEVTRISEARAGIIALAVKKGQNAVSILNALKKMPLDTMTILGVQNWK